MLNLSCRSGSWWRVRHMWRLRRRGRSSGVAGRTWKLSSGDEQLTRSQHEEIHALTQQGKCKGLEEIDRNYLR